MQFDAVHKETQILDPRQNMTLTNIPSEIRFDPLTRRTSRICHFMKLLFKKPDFDKLIAGTEERCPFCGDRVLTLTPAFPESLISGGRMVSGDMVLFPNLAPYDSLGAVLTLGSAHFIPMAEIQAETIARGFRLAMQFFRHVDKLNHPESVYHIVNWNYMPPSGSSVIHPHLQVFATSSVPNLMREEIAAAKTYREQNGSNFFSDLVRAEKELGERYLASIGRTAWLTSYAPLGVGGDIVAVVDGVHHTLGLTDQDIRDLSEGLARAMSAYDQMGFYSFNMNFFAGSRADDEYRFHLVFSPRTYFSRHLGTPDAAALRHLFNETLCMAYPEEINRMLLPYFQ
jgi:galactose-1-phosphate uridylyltransferase